jgi:hypothetical protein
MDCTRFVIIHGKESCLYSNYGAGYYKNPTMIIKLNGSNNSNINCTGDGEGWSTQDYYELDLQNWS